MRKKLLCVRSLALLFFFLVSGNLFAQQTTITGTIIDSKTNTGLPGVNVLVKGTKIGTVTDLNGKYTVAVSDPNAVLVFSFVGYLSQTIAIEGKTVIDISMEEDVTQLEEVVAIGYATQKKSDLTGAVATVNTQELKKYSTNDMGQLLQGRISGVDVRSNGEAGASPDIRIRGFSTFNLDFNPLYVVDGVQVTGQRDFNPNDIESISVLKDASAAAIYGAAAANGVILITTKHGSKNTPLKIDYSGYYGIDKMWQRIPVCGREDFQMLQNEMLTNANMRINPVNDPNDTTGAYISNIDTDWQEEAYKTGTRQNHNLNFSGGSESSMYSFNVDYYQSDGTLVGSGPNYERYSIRVNSETQKSIFKVGENVYFTHSFQDGLTYGSTWLSGGRPPLVVDLLMASPIMPVYDTSRVGGFGGTPLDGSQGVSTNVIGLNTLIKNTTEVDRTLANAWAEIEPLKGLKYKINLSYDRTFVRDIQFSPLYDMGYFINNLTASKLYDNDKIYTAGYVTNTLTYDKTLGKHTINVLAGHEYKSVRYDYKGATSEQLPEPYFIVLDNGEVKTCSGYYQESANLSYFGRLNYNFDDRYLITGTIRRDGSSLFGPENRWGSFPSVAVAWKVHNDFSLPAFISSLKIRASYGKMGNDKIGYYQYSTVVNENIPYNFDGEKIYGAAQTQLVDQSIHWEEKIMSNIGFDASFLNGAIEWSSEYYNSLSRDLLTQISIPRTTGANNDLWVNAASMKNYGFETSLSYRKRKGEFNYDVTINFNTLDNEVIELGGGKEYYDGSASRTAPGRRLGDFYGYVCEGVFQTDDQINTVAPGTEGFDSTRHAFQAARTSPGDLMFKDINTDGRITDADRDYLGRAIPKYYYGLNFSARYKGFDFTMNTSGSAGNQIHSRIYATLMHVTDYYNYHEDVLQRWTEENPSDKYPRLIQADPNANVRMSNRYGWLQNGTYLRINTLSLGYTIPQNLIKQITLIRFYVTCQNLYTFQYYKAYNPDFTSGVWNPGYDDGSYPKPRTTLFGVQATF